MAQIDIDGIKSAVKSILDAANTTTGSPIDLSSGLATRVNRVLKVDPNRIMIQPSFYPFITIVASDKQLQQTSIGVGGNMTNAKRQADLTLDIFCACHEPFVTNINEDQGAENAEKLAENIEEILRANTTLNSTVKWSVPRETIWDNAQVDEETNLRAAIIPLVCRVYY